MSAPPTRLSEALQAGRRQHPRTDRSKDPGRQRATLAAISPQSADNSLSVSEKNGLGFEVLSDLDQSVIAAYHLQYTVEGDVRDLMENVFTRDLAAENADGTWRLGVPATFVIDRHGIIAAAHCDADYRTRMEPEAILTALEALR